MDMRSFMFCFPSSDTPEGVQAAREKAEVLFDLLKKSHTGTSLYRWNVAHGQFNGLLRVPDHISTNEFGKLCELCQIPEGELHSLH